MKVNGYIYEDGLTDIGRHPESYWKLRELRPGVKPISWPWTRPRPDLSDCIAERLPDRPWLLQLWEPLHTKAPSPARCQPYCCYVATVIFYHRPYINRGGKPWLCNGRWHWSAAPAGFEIFDQVDARLRWDDIVEFDGDWFTIWNAWFHLFGFGGYDAGNLYPFCTSSPAECRKRADWHLTDDWHARDQMQFVNLPRVVELAKAADQVFVCWGNIAWDDVWIEHVVEEIQSGVAPYPDLWCWGTTQSGAPKHPMARGKHRIARDQQPILWRAA